MNAIYHVMMGVPVLRRLALGPVQVPPEPERTAHHTFAKIGPGGVRMLLVLDADSHEAVETVTVEGRVTSEVITPIGCLGLAEWYIRRYPELLNCGWQPIGVTPPLQVPPHP
ncbi:hypothetical protein [Microbispora rosea]|uniref:hypothetical protein n=1 Tax=Microbispora rosea TaxID=58117 RepID=UPI00379F7435